MSYSKRGRYFIEYENDKVVCRSNKHTYDFTASSIEQAKKYIKRIKSEYAETSPRNFKVFDMWGDVDAKTKFVPCVYQEN